MSGPDDNDPYSKGVAYGLWCACLGGLCGIHRFYLGKPISGLLYLFTFGFFGIGQLIDLFRMGDLVLLQNTKARKLLGRGAHRGQLPPRRAPAEDLRAKLVAAAARHGGKLTVAQGVMATGKPFAQIEQMLDTMARSGHVSCEVDEQQAVVVYTFGGLSGS